MLFVSLSPGTLFAAHFSCPLRKGDLETLKNRFPVTEALRWRCACASGLALRNNTCRKIKEAGPSRGEATSVVAMEELDDECQLQWWALKICFTNFYTFSQEIQNSQNF